MIRPISVVPVVAILAFLSAAGAQSGGGLDLTWSTVDCGGTIDSAGGQYALSGTMGQPDAQVPPVMAGGGFELAGGFWRVTLVCYCPGDINGDGKRDGADVQGFVDCLIADGSCSCADLDAANGVTLEDVSDFVANLLATMPCS